MGPLDVPTDVPVALPLLEILDRDGHVRQSVAVQRWPLRVGRALDNDVVLSDPHVAPSHLSIAPAEHGLAITVGETRNGVVVGSKRLRAGQSSLLATDSEAVEMTAGRTRMRLRMPEFALAPELSLASSTPLGRRAMPVFLAALLLAGGLLFSTYLDTDPDGLTRAAGGMLLTVFVAASVWCGAWALLSKTFTRQAHFGWHLRVFLFAGVALIAANALPALLAFAFSWPWMTDFAFVGEIAVVAVALYFHLLAVEPARHRLLKWVAVTCALAGVALSLWFNVQRSDLLGDELYMNHLFPPGLRVARPVSTDAFIDSLSALKPALDKKAKEADNTSDDAPRAEEE